MITFIRVVKKIWAIVRDLYAEYRSKMVYISALGILSTLFEGLGVSVLIPLMVFFASGADTSSQNLVFNFIAETFSKFDISVGFKTLLITAVAFFLLKAGVLFLLGYVRAWTVARYRMMVRTRLYGGFLAAEFAFLQKQKLGHLDAVLMKEVKQSSKLFDNIIGLILASMSMAGYAIVAIILSPYTTILAIATGILFLFIFQPAMKIIRHHSRELIISGKDASHFLAEILLGIKAVKTLAVEKPVFEKASILFKRFEKLEFRKQMAKHISKISLEPFSLFFILGVFTVSYLYLDFNFTSFVAVVYLINKVFGQVDKMQSALQLVSETLPSAVVVLSDIREVAKHQEPKDTFTPFSFNDRLSLTDVSFGTKKNSILSGVTLSVRKGQSVGIIGPSGAGKTTLVDIILRLHRPFEGEVSIDGVTAESVSVSAWRRNIVYVPQESFIMNASVADNIRFFDPSITDRDVISALKRAHLMDLVESLPGGITAKVGEHGSGLSGGERQRLALARALARNPSILILDEATSALDAHAEAVIKETIKELSQSVTVIVIAHKPSTIDYVDTVIAMRDGRIIESGSPSELMERKDSYFRQIYEKGSELPTLL